MLIFKQVDGFVKFIQLNVVNKSIRNDFYRI